MDLEQELLQIKARAYLGVARVPLESLHFPFPGSRIPNEECEVRLLEIFSGYSCQRLAHSNRIPVVISLEYLQQALEASKLSMSSIKDADPPFLWLPHEPPVLALSGRHRWEAAKKFYNDPQDRWWVVILFNQDAIPPQYLETISEECENFLPFFDGEIYYKIRLNRLRSNSVQVAKWMNRIISSSKRVDYKRLHESRHYKPFCDALDALVPLPALLFSFRLGNIRRFFRMKCPEELAVPVLHIYEVWSGIMRGFDVDLLSPADIKYLQGRSPVWSSADREYIDGLFERGEVFPRVTERDRRAVLRERIMATDTIIPSMTTFLENTKYLEPAAILLRDLLPGRFQGTIRQEMRKCYKHATASDDRFWHSYQCLWLTALRLFPYLTDFKPLQDRRGHRREFTGNYWGFLARSAVKYGFRSPKILKIIRSYPGTDMLPEPAQSPAMTTNTARRWRLKDRCGMPTEHMFEGAALFLSVENIYRSPQPATDAADLTPFAVARDAFLTFFRNGRIPVRELSPLKDQGCSMDETSSPRAPQQNGDNNSVSFPPLAANETQDTDMNLGIQEEAAQTSRNEARDAEMALEVARGPRRLLLEPPLKVDQVVAPRDLLSGAMPTPFPPTIHPLTMGIVVKPGQFQSSDPDTWQKSVPKEPQRLSPSKAKAHFENSGWGYALYVYDDHDEPRFYYPAEEDLPLIQHFISTRKHWWYARYLQGLIVTITADEVQKRLKEDRFILCGENLKDVWTAKKDSEAEI